MYLSSLRSLPSRPHPSPITLPSSSPYPLPHLKPLISSFLDVSGHVLAEMTIHEHCLLSFLLGTTRNKVISFHLSEKRELSLPHSWEQLCLFLLCFCCITNVKLAVTIFTIFFYFYQSCFHLNLQYQV